MGVSKFNLPDHSTEPLTTDGARHWMECIESSIAVENSSFLGMFAPYASTTPDMKVNIASGALSHSLGIAADSSVGGTSEQTTLTQCAVQSVTLSAPAANPRIDRIGIDSLSGSILLISGTEAVTPVAPAFPGNVIPVCQVSLVVGQTIITNAHITDERSQINFPSCGSIVGDDSAFSSSIQYAFFLTPGTYNITKPAGASFYRLTMAAGGGGYGGWYRTADWLTYKGGSGGGGSSINGIINPAENLTVVVGAGGASGSGGWSGGPSPVAGGDGGNSVVTGASSGIVINTNGGRGGASATSAPSVGAAGAGGAATSGGFAGGAGGTTNPGPEGAGTLGGKCGEQLSIALQSRTGNGAGTASYQVLPRVNGGDGFVLIEWF